MSLEHLVLDQENAKCPKSRQSNATDIPQILLGGLCSRIDCPGQPGFTNKLIGGIGLWNRVWEEQNELFWNLEVAMFVVNVSFLLIGKVVFFPYKLSQQLESSRASIFDTETYMWCVCDVIGKGSSLSDHSRFLQKAIETISSCMAKFNLWQASFSKHCCVNLLIGLFIWSCPVLTEHTVLVGEPEKTLYRVRTYWSP